MAERVQRKREKGWRMPPNTVYVGRPSRWGNPFRSGNPVYDVLRFQRTLRGLDRYIVDDSVVRLPFTVYDVKHGLVGKKVLALGVKMLYGERIDVDTQDQNVIDAVAVGHCHLVKDKQGG